MLDPFQYIVKLCTILPDLPSIFRTSMPRSIKKNGDDTIPAESSLVSPPEQVYCRQQACAVQYCLNRFHYQEKKCTAFVEEWKRCRDKVRKVARWEPMNDKK
jgi:hypothetical protein